MTKNNLNLPKIALILPCYNEELIISDTIKIIYNCLINLINKKYCSDSSFILLIDDGSKDSTWKIIVSEAKNKNHIKAIKLAFNSGHQNCLISGFEKVQGKCDALITLDADLQDDLNVISQMINEFKKGSDVVCGIKNTRKSDKVLKKFFANLFYKIMNVLGIPLIKNHADFRLISSSALKKYLMYPENNLLLRAITPIINSQIKVIKYDLTPRKKGKSKYTFYRSFHLGLEGLTSFSLVPLRLISITGLIVFVISIFLFINAFYNQLYGQVLPGWASITVPLYGISGLLMLSLGIVGEYVGKIFLEVKRRPRYIIDQEFEN